MVLMSFNSFRLSLNVEVCFYEDKITVTLARPINWLLLVKQKGILLFKKRSVSVVVNNMSLSVVKTNTFSGGTLMGTNSQ